MAQLELSVVLNLANFRTQLGKLAQASAAYYYPINLTIDKQAFKKQLTALGNIKPVIKINDSQLDAARARISTLNKSLATLRRATSTPIEIKLKYVEVGKSSSAAAGQIGRAVSGRVRADQSVAGLDQKQLIAARNMLKEADVPVSGLGKSRSLDAYRKSIIDGMANAGKESIAGLAQGLKDGQSVIGQAAKTVGDEGVRAIKDTLGIASPSRVFKRIGEFSVDGLELGFLNGLKDFKSKSIAEIKKIVALMRFELAKVSDLSGAGGPSVGSLRQRLVGQRAYTSPIGPLPVGSRAPYAEGTRGQFGGSGYEPRMVSRPYGQPLPAQSNSFLAFSRSAAQVQPSGSTPGSFLGFSQRATQVTQASGGGGGSAPPVPPRGGGGAGFNLGPNFGRDLGRGAVGRGGGIASEIASEFGQATKQVLLFGTAYKALAAITALPGNIVNATANLQSFRNQLEAVTGGGKIMTSSLKLIEDTVSKFNMPIDSARQGFVRLYASMAPAGISGETIENIFTGLAATSTTLGMSSDQVDRMTYALSQMASKGQITSEELKGQLGDVFPQAVSLFAEAAGFLNDTMDDQAKAKGISSFLKALEDGALRGEAMSKVLANVGVLLNQDFGPTGEKAAASFRGQITALSNALTGFYESFAPVASQFLGEFIQPIVQGLVTVGEAVKLALSGEAVTNNPLALYFKNELFPQLNNIKTALLGAGQVFLAFAQSIGAALRPLAQFALGNQTLVSSIARGLIVFAAFRTALATLNALGIIPLIANIIRYGTVFRVFIAQTAAGSTGVRALNTAITGTGLSTTAAIGGIRALAATIRTVLVSSAIGIAIVAIGALIERITQLQAVAESVKARGKGVSTRLGAAAKGGSSLLKEEEGNVRAEINSANKLRALYVKGTGKQGLTDTELKFIQDQGGDISMFSSGFGGAARAITEADKRSANDAASLQQRNVLTMQGRLQETLPGARKNAAVIDRRNAEKSKVDLTGLGTGLTGDSEKAAKDAKTLREEIARQAAAASDALFAEQQRLLILQQTNPIAEAIAKYTSEEASIQRELNAGLKEAKSEKEKIDLKEAARLQGAANRLELEQSINDEAEKALKPITDLLASQREELALTTETEKLMKEGISPERAKQIAQVRLLVRQQLEALDLSIDQADAAITEAKARGASAKAVEDLIAALDRLKEKRREGEKQGKAGEEGVPKDKPKDYLGDALTSAEARLKELLNPAYQLAEAAKTIGDSFGEAFKGIITGSMTVQEAFAGMFQSIADHFADMVAQMIAEWAKTQLIKGFQALLGMIIPGLGGAAGGIGGAFAGSAGGAAGFGGSFDAGIAPLPNIPDYSGAFKTAANGAVWNGGFQAFANGGIVTGPTLGLVGEGKYNEAVIPLPDGKSVPVDLGGMAGGMGGEVTSNIVVNINNGQMQGNGNSNGSELGRKIEGAVKQVLVSELRPGGILSSGRR
jgi:tape measure domain-containing protein